MLREKFPSLDFMSLPTILVPLWVFPHLVHSEQSFGISVVGASVVVVGGLIPRIDWIHCINGPGSLWRSLSVVTFAALSGWFLFLQFGLFFASFRSCWASRNCWYSSGKSSLKYSWKNYSQIINKEKMKHSKICTRKVFMGLSW